MAKTTMNAGSYKVPHIRNGKATMVEVKVRPIVNLGKRYPFASEKQNARYQRQKRGGKA